MPYVKQLGGRLNTVNKLTATKTLKTVPAVSAKFHTHITGMASTETLIYDYMMAVRVATILYPVFTM